MLYVIVYDVADDNRRAKLAKFLLDFGDRVQYSVFEAELDGNGADEMWQGVSKRADAASDSVLVYGLCGRCAAHRRLLGAERVSVPSGWILVR